MNVLRSTAWYHARYRPGCSRVLVVASGTGPIAIPLAAYARERPQRLEPRYVQRVPVDTLLGRPL